METNLPLSPGTMLRGDAYRIERVLGRGGFGITYLAYDCGLDEYVAVKEFFPNMFCSRQDDSRSVSVSASAAGMVEGMKAKFVKEARRLSRLKVNGVVNVRAAFEENGTAYYVMDYIDGGNLNDLVKVNGPLPLRQAIRYISQVAEALAAVHEQNINHLDIKPANIMLDGKKDRAVLIDFGLAKQYDEQGGQTSSTPTGLSHGYAPFEQYHRNGVRRFSPQADIYSLAATLYYLLSGVVPPDATDLLNEPLTFPDSIPAALRPVIARAMSQKVNERPATVAEFMAELNAALADTTASASPKRDTDNTVIKPRQDDATVAVIQNPPKPLPWKWIIAAVAAIAVIVGAFIWPKGSGSATPVVDSISITDIDTIARQALVQASVQPVDPPAEAPEVSNEEPTPAEQPKEEPKFSFKYRSVAPNLSMVIRYRGEVYYVTEYEWAEVPAIIKNEVKKLGLVIKGDGLEFMLEPKDLTSEELTWEEAMDRYGNRLPDKTQAAVMAKQRKEINNCMKSFGMAKMDSWYWTRTEANSAYAWYVRMNYGSVSSSYKTSAYRVRAVAPVPESSAK